MCVLASVLAASLWQVVAALVFCCAWAVVELMKVKGRAAYPCTCLALLICVPCISHATHAYDIMLSPVEMHLLACGAARTLISKAECSRDMCFVPMPLCFFIGVV